MGMLPQTVTEDDPNSRRIGAVHSRRYCAELWALVKFLCRHSVLADHYLHGLCRLTTQMLRMYWLQRLISIVWAYQSFLGQFRHCHKLKTLCTSDLTAP